MPPALVVVLSSLSSHYAFDAHDAWLIKLLKDMAVTGNDKRNRNIIYDIENEVHITR